MRMKQEQESDGEAHEKTKGSEEITDSPDSQNEGVSHGRRLKSVGVETMP